jgi:hypothetical protein
MDKEINDKFNNLFLDVEKLKIQINRLSSHIDSEGGTNARENKRIKDSLDEFNLIIYGNGKDGLLMIVDRLRQESLRIQSFKRKINFLWLSLALIIIEQVIIHFII